MQKLVGEDLLDRNLLRVALLAGPGPQPDVCGEEAAVRHRGDPAARVQRLALGFDQFPRQSRHDLCPEALRDGDLDVPGLRGIVERARVLIPIGRIDPLLVEPEVLERHADGCRERHHGLPGVGVERTLEYGLGA